MPRFARSCRGACSGSWQAQTVTDGLTIKMRRVGERRSWFLRRPRPDYEIVIMEGAVEVFNDRTTTPSSVLVSRGRVHTTDSWDWVNAADTAYSSDSESWITGS
jgi:hypothetical protein